MKRIFPLAIALLVVCPASAFAAERLRVAYSSISAAYTGIWVAQDAGFFTKEGLDSQIIFIGSATQLAQVLVAGDVDIASLGGGPVMAASLSGADLKVIGYNVNKLIFSIYARPDIGGMESPRQTHRRQPIRLQRGYRGPNRAQKIQDGSCQGCESDAAWHHVEHVRRAQVRRGGGVRGFAADSVSLGKDGIQRDRQYHRDGSCLSESVAGGLERFLFVKNPT